MVLKVVTQKRILEVETHKIIYVAILANFPSPNPLESHSYYYIYTIYQRSTSKDSYSPKILDRLVLPENEFISIFFELKMFEKAQKVLFHGILTNFWNIRPT